MKPINYHLVGYAYSGKTTLAKELEATYGFARISIDELKWRRGYAEVGDDDVPDHVWEAIFEEADQLLVSYLLQGKNVANEYAWATKEWRTRSREKASSVGCQTIFVYLDVPEQELRKRWLENSVANYRFHMPEKEFERMFSEFEPLARHETTLLYEYSKSVDEWIEVYLPHLVQTPAKLTNILGPPRSQR